MKSPPSSQFNVDEDHQPLVDVTASGGTVSDATAVPTSAEKEQADAVHIENDAELVMPDADRDSGENPSRKIQNEELTIATGLSQEDRLVRLERRESVAINIITTLAVLLALFATRSIMIPIVFAVLLALTLRPVVRRLRKWGLPDLFGSTFTLGLLVGIVALCALNLVGPARHWAETMPNQLSQLKTKLDGVLGQFKDLAATAKQVEDLAKSSEKNRNQPIPVQITQSSLSTNFAMLSSTGNVLGSTFLVIGLAFFLLVWGDNLLNNILHLLETLSDKKRTVELIYDIERGVASYLITVTMINVGLGIATGIALWLLHVPNAALWGGMATLFNYIPVFGALVGFVIVAIVSILTFDSLSYALIPPMVFIALTAFESNFITPSILGKSMSLNPILVFLALIFWGWIWGIGGAFLAVPMLAVAKVACERFEKTRPFAVLMEA